MKVLTARSATEYLYFPPINQQPLPPVPTRSLRWSVKAIDSSMQVEVHNAVDHNLKLNEIIAIVKLFKEFRAHRYSVDGERVAGEYLAWLEDPNTEVEIVYKSDANS